MKGFEDHVIWSSHNYFSKVLFISNWTINRIMN